MWSQSQYLAVGAASRWVKRRAAVCETAAVALDVQVVINDPH